MPHDRQSVAEAGQVVFELDRFHSGRESCELQGRWFGVRGRRFMRPALVAVIDGQETRLLADIEGKPWAAEDGRPWTASFPPFPKRAERLGAELTVAPDITISLPPLDGELPAPKKKPTSGNHTDTSRPRRSRTRVSELAALKRDLAGEREGRRRLEGELKRAMTERMKAAVRIEELLGELTEAIRERDQEREARDQFAAETNSLRAQRDRIAAEVEALLHAREHGVAEQAATQRERDQLVDERDQALQQSMDAAAAVDRAVAERSAALAAQCRAELERDVLIGERDAAGSERDELRSQRDAALKARTQARAVREAAITGRDEAIKERQELLRINERLQAQVAGLSSARGAALVMHRSAQVGPVSRPYTALIQRAIAMIVLLVAIIVVLEIVTQGG
ncbi:MAG: hypothetical protein ACYDHH_13225 [Solirubrobacteraceae bacterium]